MGARAGRQIATGVAVGAVMAVAAFLQVGTSAAASDPSISISAAPGLINYQQPNPSKTHITGQLSGKNKAGVPVTLQARTWPFTPSSKFEPLSTHMTRSDGTFGFTQDPSLATEYRVVSNAGATQSNQVTVHVLHGYVVTGCKLWHQHKNYGCGRHENPLPSGTYRYQFSFDFLYPASAYAAEEGKPVFVYFGQRNGSSRPPDQVKLQGTVSQTPRSGDRTHVFVVIYFTLGKKPSFWQGFVCTQTTERQDGLGREGAPGAYGCGDWTITYDQARGNLG